MKLSKKHKKVGIIAVLIVVIVISVGEIMAKIQDNMEENIINWPSTPSFINETDIQRLNFSELMSGKQLLISYYPAKDLLGFDLGRFVRKDRSDDVIEYINNEKKVGSMQQYFKYFFNEKQLLKEYSFNNKADSNESEYEKDISSNGNPFYYISKSTKEDQEEMHAGHGIVLLWEPIVKAGKYEGSQLINYYNVELPIGEERGYAFTDESTLMDTQCVISLNQIDKDEYGYLVFGGNSSVGDNINYCELLSNSTVFNLYIN